MTVSFAFLSFVVLFSCTKADTGTTGEYSVFAWNDLGM